MESTNAAKIRKKKGRNAQNQEISEKKRKKFPKTGILGKNGQNVAETSLKRRWNVAGTSLERRWGVVFFQKFRFREFCAFFFFPPKFPDFGRSVPFFTDFGGIGALHPVFCRFLAIFSDFFRFWWSLLILGHVGWLLTGFVCFSDA